MKNPTEEIQKEILYFLYSKINEKFSVCQIWEEIAGKIDVSYQAIQNNILWLQYQKDSVLKTEKKGRNKFVWIEAGKKLIEEEK
jgi:predicted transcriptional regulator